MAGRDGTGDAVPSEGGRLEPEAGARGLVGGAHRAVSRADGLHLVEVEGVFRVMDRIRRRRTELVGRAQHEGPDLSEFRKMCVAVEWRAVEGRGVLIAAGLLAGLVG